MTNTTQQVILCILDGWGVSSIPPAEDDAIAAAVTPHMDALYAQAATTELDASGEAVGLPHGQQGNSEVGHMTIGTGRCIPSELNRISTAFAPETIGNCPEIGDFVAQLAAAQIQRVHLFGLVSDGGVHAHSNHLVALSQHLLAQGYEVCIHAVLDGRDTPPRSGLQHLQELLPKLGAARIASVSGRYFAMDRDKNYTRQRAAACAIAAPRADATEVDCFPTVLAAIEAGYAADTGDEFIRPAQIGAYGTADFPVLGAREDAVLCVNFRADRSRQMMTILFDPQPDADITALALPNRYPQLPAGGGEIPHRVPVVAAITSYSERLDSVCPPLFRPANYPDSLGKIIADNGLTQLRTAETEKYAHVTFFFNGGIETPFAGEERQLVPSPKVATYDLQPEMAADEVAQAVTNAILAQQHSLIVVNFANTDMVGHTGKFPAAVQAVEAVDACMGKIRAAMDASSHHTALIVTADHGNAEKMGTAKNPHTAHTTHRVPCIVSAQLGHSLQLRHGGTLAELAPTILSLLDIPQPAAMTGYSLIAPPA